VRAIIASIVLVLTLGPVAQAAGHGACQGGHATSGETASDERASGTDDAHAHHRHAGVPAGDEMPSGNAAGVAHGKCECGCLCADGHACFSAAPASLVETAGYLLVPVRHSPPSDEAGFANFVSSPHTRPPIDMSR
jgi:hypothetical protein